MNGFVLIAVILAGVIVSAFVASRYKAFVYDVEDLDDLTLDDRVREGERRAAILAADASRTTRNAFFVLGVLIVVAVVGFARVQPVAEQAQETAEASRQIALQADHDRCTGNNNGRLRTREQRRMEMFALQDELDRREEEVPFEANDIPGYDTVATDLRAVLDFFAALINGDRIADIDFLRTEINRQAQEYVAYIVAVPLADCGEDPSTQSQ